MARSAESHLQSILGELAFLVAQLRAENDALRDQLAAAAPPAPPAPEPASSYTEGVAAPERSATR